MRISLSPDDVAASAYRSFHAACLRAQPPDFDGLPWEEQQEWFRLALGAERLLEEYHGRPYPEAASALAALHAGGDAPRETPRGGVAWQAVCRHLMTLLDCDEVFDLEALELSWREWAKSRHHLEGVIP